MTPKEINSTIQSYDPMLRLKRGTVWRPYKMMDGARLVLGETIWRVERRVQNEIIISDKPRDMSWADWHEIQDPDTRASAKERYLLVFTCWPNELDRRIYYTLMISDMAKSRPGLKAQEITNRVKEAQARAKEAFGDEVGYQAKEWYRYINTVRVAPEGYHAIVPAGGMSITGGL